MIYGNITKGIKTVQVEIDSLGKNHLTYFGPLTIGEVDILNSIDLEKKPMEILTESKKIFQ